MPYKDPKIRKQYHQEYYICHKVKWDMMHIKQRDSGYWKEFNQRYDRKIRNLRYAKQRIAYRDRRIFLHYNPRTGICSKCGKRPKKTHMHHDLGYFTIFPWFGIKELCPSCHIRLIL